MRQPSPAAAEPLELLLLPRLELPLHLARAEAEPRLRATVRAERHGGPARANLARADGCARPVPPLDHPRLPPRVGGVWGRQLLVWFHTQCALTLPQLRLQPPLLPLRLLAPPAAVWRRQKRQGWRLAPPGVHALPALVHWLVLGQVLAHWRVLGQVQEQRASEHSHSRRPQPRPQAVQGGPRAAAQGALDPAQRARAQLPPRRHRHSSRARAPECQLPQGCHSGRPPGRRPALLLLPAGAQPQESCSYQQCQQQQQQCQGQQRQQHRHHHGQPHARPAAQPRAPPPAPTAPAQPRPPRPLTRQGAARASLPVRRAPLEREQQGQQEQEQQQQQQQQQGWSLDRPRHRPLQHHLPTPRAWLPAGGRRRLRRRAQGGRRGERE
jgi:hypothetical protein